MYPRVEGDVSEEEQVSDSIKKVHIQFEQNWQEISRVYGLMLHPKTLKVMKGVAWNTYLLGRTDEMARQLEASRMTASLSQRGQHAPV